MQIICTDYYIDELLRGIGSLPWGGGAAFLSKLFACLILPFY